MTIDEMFGPPASNRPSICEAIAALPLHLVPGLPKASVMFRQEFPQLEESRPVALAPHAKGLFFLLPELSTPAIDVKDADFPVSSHCGWGVMCLPTPIPSCAAVLILAGIEEHETGPRLFSLTNKLLSFKKIASLADCGGVSLGKQLNQGIHELIRANSADDTIRAGLTEGMKSIASALDKEGIII